MVILISSFAFLLLGNALLDGLRVRFVKGTVIDHDEQTLLAAVSYLFFGVCIALWQGIDMYHLFGAWVLVGPARWIVHDLVFNICTGLPWDYVGTTARLDRWLRRQVIHPLPIKLGLLAVSIEIVILIT